LSLISASESGERCMLPQRVRGGAQAGIAFDVFEPSYVTSA